MINQYDNEIINELWDRKDSHEIVLYRVQTLYFIIEILYILEMVQYFVLVNGYSTKKGLYILLYLIHSTLYCRVSPILTIKGV